MPFPQDDHLGFRREFPIVDRVTYLVSHSLGAMPRGARARLEAFADEWDGLGVGAWSREWWSMPLAAGNALAPLLGARPGSIVFQPSVTIAAAVFLSALRFEGTRRKIVTTELEFPSLLYMLEGLSERGARIVTLPSTDGLSIAATAIADALDEEVAVLVISHVFFRSSARVDVAPIVARAKETGTIVLLDVYQSAGIVPIDLESWGVDAAVGGCLKWLCGGPGNAFLYVRPELIPTLRPTLTGWQAHRAPFDFAMPPIEPSEKGAMRFLHGTPNISAHRAAEAGIDILRGIGIDAVRAHNVALTERFLARCDREGWPVYTPRAPEERGGSVSVHPPHAYEISRVLLEEGFIIDFRIGTGIRIGPHFYNGEDEVDRVGEAIARSLASGSWRPHAGRARAFVT